MNKQQIVTEKSSRKLFVSLSETETEEMTKNLTENLMNITALTEQKKASARKFKAEIDDLHDNNANLAKWLHDKGMDTDVAVEIRYNWPEDGVKTLTRMDTHETWQEDMEPSEQRLDNLPGVGTGANDEEE